MPKISNQLFLNSDLDYNATIKKNEPIRISIGNNLDSASSSSNKCTGQWSLYYNRQKDSESKEMNSLAETKSIPDQELIQIDHDVQCEAENRYNIIQSREKHVAASPLISASKKNILLSISILLGSAAAGAFALRHYVDATKNMAVAPLSNSLRNNITEKRFPPITTEKTDFFVPSMHPVTRKTDAPYQYYSDIRGTDPHTLFDNDARVIALLKENGLLAYNSENNIRKEYLLPAVAKYIHNTSAEDSQQSYRERMVARSIVLEESSLLEDQKHYLANQSDQDIIQKWLFYDVYGMSTGQYIANKMKEHEELSNLKIGDLNNMLGFSQLMANKLFSYHVIPADQWGEFNLMWYKYLGSEIPMLRWDDTDMDHIPLKSHEFADLFTGAMVLDKNGFLRIHQLEELMDAGKKQWSKAIKNGVDASKVDLYTLPSFIVLAANKKDFVNVQNSSAEICLAVIDQYLEYRKETA